MSPLVTIALVTLLLTASTVLITFCTYSQERSNHTWLVKILERSSKFSLPLFGSGAPGKEYCDSECQLERCKLHTEKSLKESHQEGASNELLLCKADSYLGLGDFVSAAAHFELASKSTATPDEKTLIQLSHIYTDILLQPNSTISLLQPYLQPQTDFSSATTESTNNLALDVSTKLSRNLQLSCAYLQALVHMPSHTQQMLQYIETLRTGNISFDSCIYYAQHQVLVARMYYADAYQTSVEFMRAYPTLYHAHMAMGEALLLLQRTAEATAVLRVAHSLVDVNEVRATLSSSAVSRNTTLDALVRLGHGLYACDALTEAEEVYGLVKGLLQPAELAQQCALLSRIAQLYLKLDNYPKAYVTSLQCVKYCPKFYEGYLQLGNSQHRLGLLHDAATSLKVAARSKALKKEARAQLKAVKATEDAQLRKQARDDEEKLGPQPPLDPNVKRKEHTGLYIDFLAQLQKEREEKEKQERDAVASSGDSASTASAEKTGKSDANHEAEGKSKPATETPKQQIEPAREGDSLRVEEISPTDQEKESSSSSAQAAHALADQYIAYANAFIAQNNPSEAMKKLKVAIKKAPLYADAYLVRGDLHASLGDFSSASADYLKIYIELDPKNATCAYKVHNIVLQMVQAGQTADGVALLTQLGHSPVLNDEHIAMDLAAALAQNKEYKSALLVLYSIDPLVPHTTQRVKLIARMHEHMGSVVRASETLFTGIHQNLTTYEDLGEMYVRNGYYTMAIKAFESGLSSSSTPTSSAESIIKSETARLHDHLARAYLALHEETQTAAVEDAVLDIEGGEVQTDFSAEQDREHLTKAIYHYQKADKYGAFNAEMRKFYTRYPEFFHTSADDLGSSERAQEGSSEGTHTARSHTRPRWLSRRSATETVETDAIAGAAAESNSAHSPPLVGETVTSTATTIGQNEMDSGHEYTHQAELVHTT